MIVHSSYEKRKKYISLIRIIWHFTFCNSDLFFKKTINQIAINFSSFHTFIHLQFVALLFYSAYADMRS